MTEKERNSFGLTERDMLTFRQILGKYPSVKTVVVIGSRAKGNFKQGSDVDLVIMDPGISETVITKLKSDFQESSLPYNVDLIACPTLKHDELKEHIDRVGRPFYHAIRQSSTNA